MLRKLLSQAANTQDERPTMMTKADVSRLDALPHIGLLPWIKRRAIRRSLLSQTPIDTFREDVPGYRIAACHRFGDCTVFAGVSNDGQSLMGTAQDMTQPDNASQGPDPRTAARLAAAITQAKVTGRSQIDTFRGIEVEDWTREEASLVPRYMAECVAERALDAARLSGNHSAFHALRRFAGSLQSEQSSRLLRKMEAEVDLATDAHPQARDLASKEAHAASPAPQISAPGKDDRVKSAARRLYADQASKTKVSGQLKAQIPHRSGESR